ncbi:Uncharacterised protein [Mycobacteroides abscessus subsp. massiliense]|nr:Uncharacterised protein [Mycobacteroides abscessus subsp. massiliense]
MGIVVGGGRLQDREHRVDRACLFPHRQVRVDKALTDRALTLANSEHQLVGIDHQLDRLTKQLILRPEEVHDHGRIDTRIAGNTPDGRLLIAALGE